MIIQNLKKKEKHIHISQTISPLIIKLNHCYIFLKHFLGKKEQDKKETCLKNKFPSNEIEEAFCSRGGMFLEQINVLLLPIDIISFYYNTMHS